MSSLNVVLVGAGHAHLHLARHAHRFRDQGIGLTLVDPGTFWYSGLATGMLGGAHEREDDQVDPARLIESNGGRFVADRAVGLDRARRRVPLASGAALPYDAVSFNVGSRVPVEILPGADQSHAFAVKPIANLWRLRQRLEEHFALKRSDGARRLNVVVIGGGATGCEIAANLADLARRRHAEMAVRLIVRSERLLPRHGPGAAASLATALRDRDIDVMFGADAHRLEAGRVIVNGNSLPCDLAVLATGLKPAPLMRDLNLPVDDEGGLRVGATLRSLGDRRVFAAGDCASLEGHALPKVGVFGVRQAPILLHNLPAFLTGRPLRTYRPQKRYLIILNLGFGEALAIRGRLHWRGRLSLRLKEWIDRRWLRRYQR